MEKLKIAVVGYGNIGRYVVEAVETATDMELVGVVRRAVSLGDCPRELSHIPVTGSVEELGKVDVAILCAPTRSIPAIAQDLLSKGINTVDSFDIHGDALWNLHQSLAKIGKEKGAVAIVSAGWDPGSDSVIRTMLLAMAPKGITYTNFGPGMSMGHSVVVNSKPGVKNALSMTIPAGNGVHNRMVYVELEDGANFAEVEKSIKIDSYFVKDHTVVTQVPCVDTLLDMGHGVHIERKGVSGKTQNQFFEFNMKINNPALTAQILVSCARATMKQSPGAYTMPEIAPMDYLPGDIESLIKSLV